MKRTFPVIGMACANCAATVEKTIRCINGVHSVAVSLASRSALVDYDEQTVTPQVLEQAVSDVGFELVVEEDRDANEQDRQYLKRLTVKVVAGWAFAASVMLLTMSKGSQIIIALITLLSMLTCGKSFYVSAWRRLRHGGAGMDTLVAMSTLVAFAASFVGEHVYFDTATMILAFILTGRLLEEKAKNGAASSIRSLMSLQPKTVKLYSSAPMAGQEGTLQEVPISTLKIGDIVEVTAGDKIPVDGEIVEANSFMTSDAAYVDESMLSGEPSPIAKRKGHSATAGTMLRQGRLRLRVQQTGSNTVLARIIRLVHEAQGSKAPVQRIVDKAALVFVPVVVGLSLFTFLTWWAVGGNQQLHHALVSAIAVLVVACPCAMGLATPTALLVGIGRAARRQILIKDVAALESLRKVDAIVIDKTGTLTVPNLNVDFTKAETFALEEREQLKPNAREAVEQLRRQGVELYLMSGDSEDAVAYWADKAGISHWHANATPSDKQALVAELQKQGRTVAMVGDGINDTQALALADVSIAMGRGTDVAMDVSQLTIMTDNLRAIPEALGLSRCTVRMIWQNLFWAFVYNIVSIPLAAGALHIFGIDFQITPMWAAALMALSSISVVLNSLRLR